MSLRRDYESAAATFADLVARTPLDRLAGHGLGEWSLRDLIGHTVSAALRPVSLAEVDQQPPPPPAVGSPEAYGAFIQAAPAEMIAAAQASVTRNAIAFGLDLGDQPGKVVAEHVDRAVAVLNTVHVEQLVVTPVGPMRLRDWLPTRTLELVVHSSDIALVAGVDVTFEPGVVAETAALAARMAAAMGAGIPVLRSLTGRGPLPDGFTTVL